MKGIEQVIGVWVGDQSFFLLMIILKDFVCVFVVLEKWVIVVLELLNEEWNWILNEVEIYICLFIVEGWGYYIIEVMLVGVVVVMIDVLLMNEYIWLEWGYLVGVMQICVYYQVILIYIMLNFIVEVVCRVVVFDLEKWYKVGQMVWDRFFWCNVEFKEVVLRLVEW